MNVNPLHEFDDGVAYWATRPQWPSDLHNRFYREQHAITDGTFSRAWWEQTRRRLQAWRAFRGTSYADLDSGYLRYQADLVDVWRTVIEPRLTGDITTVTWQEVRTMPDLAASIRPTRSNSGVFPSKLSHFIAPHLFPVLDRTALSGGQRGYRNYFELVQETWAATSAEDQEALRARLTTLVQARSGEPLFSGFPIVNKIVELRLIGRRHPAAPHR